MDETMNDKITIEISSSSTEYKEIREQGIFFEVVADALNIDRSDIKELVKQ